MKLNVELCQGFGYPWFDQACLSKLLIYQGFGYPWFDQACLNGLLSHNKMLLQF